MGAVHQEALYNKGFDGPWATILATESDRIPKEALQSRAGIANVNLDLPTSRDQSPLITAM